MESNTTAYTKTFSIDIQRANYHRKCRERKIKRLIIVLAIWLVIFVYMITPLSRVNLSIKGNVYYGKEELVDMGYINENRLWWLLDEDKVIKVLESYDYINNVEIKKSLFGTKMVIEEMYPVGVKNGQYVMNDGTLINKENYVHNSKIVNLASFENVGDINLGDVALKYSKVNIDIRDDFYDVELVITSNEYKYVKLYGYKENIGYFVIKTDLVYLDTKFKENKYSKIIEEVEENNVKYSKENPCFVAYHYVDEEEFHIVSDFEEE